MEEEEEGLYESKELRIQRENTQELISQGLTDTEPGSPCGTNLGLHMLQLCRTGFLWIS